MSASEGMIAAIRERLKSPQSFGYGVTHYQNDCADLLDEIDRLRAEVERLNGELEDRTALHRASSEICDVLEKERDALREALQKANDVLGPMTQSDGDKALMSGVFRAHSAIRGALRESGGVRDRPTKADIEVFLREVSGLGMFAAVHGIAGPAKPEVLRVMDWLARLDNPEIGISHAVVPKRGERIDPTSD